MINKFTKAVASIMLSSAMFIPASMPIIAQAPTQAENMTAETFINTYLSKTVVKDNVTTYEPFKTVDDSNYEQILSGESVYTSLSKELQEEVDKQATANTGMNYESLLNTAKEKKQAIEEAKKQEQPQESKEQTSMQTDSQTAAQSQTATQPQSNAAVQSSAEPVQKPAEPAQSKQVVQTQPASQAANPAQTTTADPASITYTRTASTANGIHVNASYTGDTFNEDVNLVVSDVAKAADSYSVDISFQKADGTEVEPNAGKSVSISISYPSLKGTEFEVVHTDENQKNADIQVSSVNATSAVFSTSTFSVFTVQAKVQAAPSPVQNTSAEPEQKADTAQGNESQEKVSVEETKDNQAEAADATIKNEKVTDNTNTENQKAANETKAENKKADVKENVANINILDASNAKATAYQTIAADAKSNTESDIDEQAQAFVMTYLTSATGVVYQRANANNYQAILNSGNAWNQLNINVRRRVNQILTNEIGKTYLKLLNEAKQMANASPSTGIETNVVSYSVMFGTSILGAISVRKKKKEVDA